MLDDDEPATLKFADVANASSTIFLPPDNIMPRDFRALTCISCRRLPRNPRGSPAGWARGMGEV